MSDQAAGIFLAVFLGVGTAHEALDWDGDRGTEPG